MRAVLAFVLALLAGCASEPPPPARTPAVEAAAAAGACPAGMPVDTHCFEGRDSAGAHYLIAQPRDWNGVLVLHAHGGPALGAPRRSRVVDDARRWAIFVKAGYAWAGTGYHQGGVAVMSAVEDVERLQRIVQQHGLQPRRTILHGQSWGAGVAARAAEAGRAGRYDGVLLTSGMVGGGSRSYDFRLDLRVLYQQLCGNHPLPGEPAYPLWQGLPPDAGLTSAQLKRRVDDCLGLDKPMAARTPEQRARVETIERVIRIPERSIHGHLAWATWHFQDIVQRRTGGLNPFSNLGVRYAGSADDATLNDAVPRYRADPAAVAQLAADADPTGRITIPVLSVHAIDDPIAFVEVESVFRETVERAGSGERLVQAFTEHAEHSYLADPVYPALAAALLDWVERGDKPTPAALAGRCRALEARFGSGCRLRPDYQPAPIGTRVPERIK